MFYIILPDLHLKQLNAAMDQKAAPIIQDGRSFPRFEKHQWEDTTNCHDKAKKLGRLTVLS